MNKQNEFINLRVNREARSIPVDEILFTQSYGNYVKLFTQSGAFLSMITTNYLESKLPKVEFLRVHKSYIVNRSKISFASHKSIRIADRTIPIGKTYIYYVHHSLAADA